MQKLADHWANHHDWRRAEAQIFSYPNFVTNIDGLDIHFIHVKSKHPNALPLIITHGWPGSIIEQLKIIGPLTDPTAHGGTAADAFDVVIPSLPGYGFSGKPTAPGWDVPAHRQGLGRADEAARLHALRRAGRRLGQCDQRSDGAAAAAGAARASTPTCRRPCPRAIRKALPAGPPPPDLSPDEQHAWDQLTDFYMHGLGYANEMNQRPQTLYGARGFAGRPRGLDPRPRHPELRPDRHACSTARSEGLTRDDILDNITLYWLTNTAVSSARLYWENRNGKGGFFDPRGVPLPTGVSAFRTEIYQPPESWARAAYPHLVFYKAHDVGTHFAAWEQPQLLTEDMRETFRSVR